MKKSSPNPTVAASEIEADSGFYSPTGSGPPRLEDHSAVINGTDHPDQSSTELNGLEVS